MALTVLKGGVDVQLDARRATLLCAPASASDLPDKGDDVSALVTYAGGSGLGASWYAAEVQYQWNVASYVTIVARQAGWDWTWVGLAPITREDNYSLKWGMRLNAGAMEYGYWLYFSNWDMADNWSRGEAPPLASPLRSWIVEWVAASRQAYFLHKVNGSWPTGFSPPAGTGAGLYKCIDLKIELEPSTDWSGSPTTYYRHFGTFYEAPVIDATQMTWIGDTWSP